MNASQSPASKTRLIKKYPNRRLYDTTLSRYITLEDVCDLITNRVDVRVIEQRGERDITRDILLQVFAVQEQEMHRGSRNSFLRI